MRQGKPSRTAECMAFFEVLKVCGDSMSGFF